MNRHPDPWLLVVAALAGIAVIFVVFDLIVTISPNAFAGINLF